jgi:predicted dehydrogenase
MRFVREERSVTQPVRLAVLGAGSISLRGILPHCTMPDVQDRVRVTAVCDTAPGRAQAAAEKFGVPQAFESYEELLRDGEFDALSIATPIGLHYEQGKAAIEAGKHLHFNKTMTTTAAEADDLIARAEQRGVKLVSSPGEMLRPHNQRIREMIRNGDLGRLAWATTGAAFGTYHEKEGVRQGEDVLANIDPSWYYRRPGGGPLYDMTVYGLHALTGILGPAKRVTGLSGVGLTEREFRGQMVPCDMDDNTLMLLDFGETLFAFVYGAFAGHIVRGFQPSFFGTKGSIVGQDLNGQPIDYEGRELAQAKGGNALLPHVVGPHREVEEAHVYEDIMQLVDLVREGVPTVSNAEHARHVIDIIESAYRSAATGQAQALRTTFVPLEVKQR